MATRPLPSPEVVRQLIRYDPEAGKLFWNYRGAIFFTDSRRHTAAMQARIWNTKYADREAFTPTNSKDYHTGSILGKMLLAHRVAWVVSHGRWPVEFIDHINGVRSDNRLINLREASHAENSRNCTAIYGASGIRGVRRDGKGWQARMRIDGKTRALGTFPTIDEAALAYRNAANTHHGNFAGHNCQ